MNTLYDASRDSSARLADHLDRRALLLVKRQEILDQLRWVHEWRQVFLNENLRLRDQAERTVRRSRLAIAFSRHARL